MPISKGVTWFDCVFFFRSDVQRFHRQRHRVVLGFLPGFYLVVGFSEVGESPNGRRPPSVVSSPTTNRRRDVSSSRKEGISRRYSGVTKRILLTCDAKNSNHKGDNRFLISFSPVFLHDSYLFSPLLDASQM